MEQDRGALLVGVVGMVVVLLLVVVVVVMVVMVVVLLVVVVVVMVVLVVVLMLVQGWGWGASRRRLLPFGGVSRRCWGATPAAESSQEAPSSAPGPYSSSHSMRDP